MRRMLLGALAGMAATVPMTLAMIAMHRRLPRRERYPLPPRAVTMEVLDSVGVQEQQLDESQKSGVTLLSHFGYGAGVGALYAPLAHAVRLPPLASGCIYGLTVWAGSYLGWLPAAGLITPATEHPARRNALMITAHLVWGATTAIIIDRLDGQEKAKGQR